MPRFVEPLDYNPGDDRLRLCYDSVTEILQLTEEDAIRSENLNLIFAKLTTRGAEPVSEDYRAVRMKMDWSINEKVPLTEEDDEYEPMEIANWSFPLISIQPL